MATTNWLKQTNEPLFPKVFWDRPLNKRAAKRLLIIGGHARQFDVPQQAYQAALAAGIGQAKVALPSSVQKLAGTPPDCVFTASTKSGSFAASAYEEIAVYIKESDAVLLAGELSHNSETITLVDRILSETSKPLILASDVIELMLHQPQLVMKPNHLLLAPTKLLVKLAGALGIAIRLQPDSLVSKIDLLEQLAATSKPDLLLLGHEVIVHSQGKTSVTVIDNFSADLFGLARGAFATFWAQHANRFEALTTATFVLSQLSKLPDQGFAISLKNLENVLARYS